MTQLSVSFLSRNVLTKLAALLLALLVYAHVYTEREQVFDLEVPVHVSGLSENLLLTREPPASKKLTVRAKGKQLLKLRRRPPEVVLDLTGVTRGEVQRTISAGDVVLPLGAEAEVTRVHPPRLVLLEVDSLITMSLPVRLATTGELPPDFAWLEPASTVPAEVRVHGPYAELAHLDEIATHPVPLSLGPRVSGTQVGLVSPGPFVTVDPDSITMVLPLARVTTRNLEEIPVSVRNGSGNMFVRVMPETAMVQVAGPRAKVEALDPGLVVVQLDIRGLDPGLHRVPPQVTLSVEGLEVRALLPSEFLVDVGPPTP